MVPKNKAPRDVPFTDTSQVQLPRFCSPGCSPHVLLSTWCVTNSFSTWESHLVPLQDRHSLPAAFLAHHPELDRLQSFAFPEEKHSNPWSRPQNLQHCPRFTCVDFLQRLVGEEAEAGVGDDPQDGRCEAPVQGFQPFLPGYPDEDVDNAAVPGVGTRGRADLRW